MNWILGQFRGMFIKITFHFSNTFSKKVEDEHRRQDQDPYNRQ